MKRYAPHGPPGPPHARPVKPSHRLPLICELLLTTYPHRLFSAASLKRGRGRGGAAVGIHTHTRTHTQMDDGGNAFPFVCLLAHCSHVQLSGGGQPTTGHDRSGATRTAPLRSTYAHTPVTNHTHASVIFRAALFVCVCVCVSFGSPPTQPLTTTYLMYKEATQQQDTHTRAVHARPRVKDEHS